MSKKLRKLVREASKYKDVKLLRKHLKEGKVDYEYLQAAARAKDHLQRKCR